MQPGRPPGVRQSRRWGPNRHGAEYGLRRRADYCDGAMREADGRRDHVTLCAHCTPSWSERLAVCLGSTPLVSAAASRAAECVELLARGRFAAAYWQPCPRGPALDAPGRVARSLSPPHDAQPTPTPTPTPTPNPNPNPNPGVPKCRRAPRRRQVPRRRDERAAARLPMGDVHPSYPNHEPKQP